jgi:Ca2+/Na+ antiporter
MLIEFNVNQSAFTRDVPVVVGMTLVLLLMSRFPSELPRHLTRVKGILLLTGFVIYQLYLYYEVSSGST